MNENRPPANDNPLLEDAAYPAFDRIGAQHVAPAMRQLLDDLGAELADLEAHAQPTWEGLVEPLERLGDRLRVPWGIVGHLMGVKNSDELRAAYEDMQPAVVEFSMRLGQSQAVYRGLQGLRNGAAWQDCDATQRRIVEVLLRDAELSGVGLQGEKRERFNAIQQELAELGTRFSNNVLDATKAFALTLEEPQDVAGLPASLRQVAAQAAREAGSADASADEGPWRITLDYPSFMPFMAHSRRRDYREQLYRASISRASSGDLDNTPLIARILQLRREMAALLGYGSFAELSLASKMAPDVAAIEGLLEELRQASLDGGPAGPGGPAPVRRGGRGARGGGPAPLGPAVLGRAPARAGIRLQRGGLAAVFPAAARSGGVVRPRPAAVRGAHRGGGRGSGVARRRAVFPHP